MAIWKPDIASMETEELMEEHDLPEEDRDEVRRFSEFLRRRKDKKAGRELPPMPKEMRDWLLGKE